jgi:CDP-diacylglycerol--glycerol-3-phosphate 3-phosphatidyltransferase
MSGYRRTGRAMLEWMLSPLVDGLASVGVSANAVTLFSLCAGLVSGASLALGHFGWATVAIAVASLGDGVDGMLARRTGTASAGGALLDAAVDRYEELFVLAGLALLFHDSVPVLVLVLAAIGGSFMVSYGSAKAEAFGVSVPDGMMRRAERAVVLCTGVALVAFVQAVARRLELPALQAVAQAPVLLAVAIVAVGSNVSAVRRLTAIAAVATERRSAGTGRLAREPTRDRAVEPAPVRRTPAILSRAWARTSSTTTPPPR